jgi:hypothetical protein
MSTVPGEDIPVLGPRVLLVEICEKLKAKYGKVGFLRLPILEPIWPRGDFFYKPTSTAPMNEFQVAFYHLFRESWRARICAGCSGYFIAAKPPQMYCSTECSNAAHRPSVKKWWDLVGAKRRANQYKNRPKKFSRERKLRRGKSVYVSRGN